MVMPPLFFVLTASCLLIPPLFGIAMILFGTHYSPHQRTSYVLGGGLLLNILISSLLIFWDGLLARQWTSLLGLGGLWTIGAMVYHILHLKTLQF